MYLLPLLEVASKEAKLEEPTGTRQFIRLFHQHSYMDTDANTGTANYADRFVTSGFTF